MSTATRSKRPALATHKLEAPAAVVLRSDRRPQTALPDDDVDRPDEMCAAVLGFLCCCHHFLSGSWIPCIVEAGMAESPWGQSEQALQATPM